MKPPMDEPWTVDEIFAALGAACRLTIMRMHDLDEETGESVVWVEARGLDGKRYRVFADHERAAAFALAEALGVELPDEAMPRRG